MKCALPFLLLGAGTTTLCAAGSVGTALKMVPMKEILAHVNMTYDELFPKLRNGDGDTGGDFVYHYHQGTARFTGPSFDGSTPIDVTGCSGLQNDDKCGEGECRNNAAAQCCKDCGPCPQGEWQISHEIVYHNMKHCYALSPVGTQVIIVIHCGFIVGRSKAITGAMVYVRTYVRAHVHTPWNSKHSRKVGACTPLCLLISCCVVCVRAPPFS